MMTVIWGWEPPQYEILNNGNIRIFFYSESFTETFTSYLSEINEEITNTFTYWKCNVIESDDIQLSSMIKENPQTIECQKRLLMARITAYDSSEHVNSFTIGDTQTWIDKATRVGLKLRFEAEKRLGKTVTTLWQNGLQFQLPLIGDVTALDMLDSIELYASACYDVTQMHLATVENLANAEEIRAYDYTTGYPEKLQF